MAVGRETGSRDYKLLNGALRGSEVHVGRVRDCQVRLEYSNWPAMRKSSTLVAAALVPVVDLDVVFPIPLFFPVGLPFTCYQAP
jgi:hypothetical protein